MHCLRGWDEVFLAVTDPKTCLATLAHGCEAMHTMTSLPADMMTSLHVCSATASKVMARNMLTRFKEAFYVCTLRIKKRDIKKLV
ncbi:hypothetical protein E2C01_039976 [Portunus trituberculatus]|uniref:Uncharacterized protein n=1 Tax=Portunus trituberculatus TaxID=210409 RepID=A0A5B7FIF0_PORTR|nr:hypothetical protein [Portunus trituberculatus]